ncbi:MAG: glycosyltransferase family 87 protein, partial [Flavobacteriales bacterium]
MKQTLVLAMGAALVLSLAIDGWLTRRYAGVDLRDKVVGARSLMAGRSLYFDPWRPGDDERFADPSVPPGATMTRYTGTPFQALMLAPLGSLPYSTIRLTWLLIQYALMVAAALLAFRASDDRSARAMVLAAAVLAIALASGWWRLHVERGQVYVAFAALLAGLFWSLRRERPGLAGVLAAILVLMKPTHAFLLLPLAWRAERRMLLGGLSLALVAAGVFALLPNGLRAWAEYAEAMRA